MSIALYKEQGKTILAKWASLEVVLGLGGIFIGLGAFGLGRLYGQGEINTEIILETVMIEEKSNDDTKVEITTLPSPETGKRGSVEGSIVASKNGTKFHYPWCPGASQIKNENKIFFANESDAIAAGYTKAANCN